MLVSLDPNLGFPPCDANSDQRQELSALMLKSTLKCELDSGETREAKQTFVSF